MVSLTPGRLHTVGLLADIFLALEAGQPKTLGLSTSGYREWQRSTRYPRLTAITFT